MKSVKQNKVYQPFVYIITALLYTVRVSLFGGVMYSLINRGLFILFFAMSFYYFFKANQLNGKNKVCRCLNVLVILVLVYGIIFAIVGTDGTWLRPTTSFFFFESYLQSILPIYAFYYFGRKGWIDELWFKRITILFVVFVVYYFIIKRDSTRILHDDAEEITNNAGYMVLSIFPILAFYKKKPVVFYTLMLLASMMIISGGKRGAIILGGLCLLYSLIKVTKGTKIWNKIIVFLSFSVVAYLVWRYYNDMLQNSDYFNNRMIELSEGKGSYREDMYPLYFAFLLNSNVFRLIFGHGADGTCHYLGLMAHNDWLEMSINMGLIGFFALLAYWVNIFRLWIKGRNRIKTDVVMALGMFVIIYFGKTIVSMSIMEMDIVATSVFGYCLSVYDNRLES